jgi:hypothetical protein
LRATFLTGAFLLSLFSLSVSLTGGFVSSVWGWRISSRSPWPALVAAAVLTAFWLLLARRQGRTRADLERVNQWVASRWLAIILAVAGMAGAVAIRTHTFSAAGADASGYLSAAALFQSGKFEHAEPLTPMATWRDAATSLAPLGWRSAPAPGLQVPTYAAGLPILMALPHAAGGTIGASLLVPYSFALAIAAAGTIARRVAGPTASVLAAVWLATSPIGLVSAMQPMSDMPVTAAWLCCWALIVQDRERAGGLRARVWLGGAAAALAVIMRPNLAPLAAVPALYVLVGDPSTLFRQRLRNTLALSLPIVLAGLLIAYFQWRWFGSPLRSGYGTAGDIYEPSNLAANTALYTRWLLETHGLWLLPAPLAVLLSGARTLRWLLAFAAMVVLGYLIYAVFEVWTYLRFLLPALALAAIAVAALVGAGLARLPAALRPPLLVVVALLLVQSNVSSAQRLGVFRIGERHARASLAGHYLKAMLLPSAVLITGEQSGALRYYTDRSILRWDVMPAETLTAAVGTLSAAGSDLWVVLDDWEEDLFRRKFQALAFGALDWPPVVDAGAAMRTRAWRLRDRHQQSDRVLTDRLR